MKAETSSGDAANPLEKTNTYFRMDDLHHHGRSNPRIAALLDMAKANLRALPPGDAQLPGSPTVKISGVYGRTPAQFRSTI